MSGAESPLIRRLRPKSVMLLFAAIYFVSYLTRINYAAVIAAIIAEEKITATHAAVAVTGAFITYGAGQLVSGWLSDRLQPSKLVAFALITTSAANLAVPFCSADLRNAVWCVNGIAQAFIWPPLVRMIPELLNSEYQLKAGVRISWGGHFGNIAVYLLAPLFIHFSGWKSIFIFSSAVGFITVAVWLVLCSGFKTELKKKEKSKAPAGDFSVVGTGALLLPFIFTVIAIIIQGSLRDGVTTWMPSYISETFSLGSDISILSGVIMPVFAFLCIWATEYLYYKIKSVQKCCFMYFSVSFIAALLIPVAVKSGAVLSVFFSVAYCGLNARNKHFANLYAAAQHRQYRAARFYFGYFQRLRLYRQRPFHLRLCAHFRNLRLERYNTCMVHLLGGGRNYLSLPLQKQALRQNVKIF